MKRFKVKLKAVHEQTGQTAYSVAKATELAQNTVRKYTAEDIIIDYIPTTVVTLCQYYGVDWRDPEIIEVIEDESDPSISNPALAPAERALVTAPLF